MKRLFHWILIIVFLTIPGRSLAADGPVINKNPGFESILKNFPKYWYCVGMLKPEVEFKLDKKIKHSGKASASIRIRKLTKRVKDFGPPNWAQDIMKNIPGGKKVRLTAYIRTREVVGIAPIGVQCWDMKSKKIIKFGTTQFEFPISGTTGWKKVSFELMVPRKTSKIRILCMLSGTGTVWFDNVILEPIK